MSNRFRSAMVLTAAWLAASLPLGCSSPGNAEPPRTVALSMKAYTFNGKNPTLTFKPGERVHFIVTNDESTRVLHNFRIVGMDVPCGPPFLPGGRREVVVTMPRSGEFAYTCCTHPGMGGKLVVSGK